MYDVKPFKEFTIKGFCMEKQPVVHKTWAEVHAQKPAPKKPVKKPKKKGY